jgi:hypothetical protein
MHSSTQSPTEQRPQAAALRALAERAAAKFPQHTLAIADAMLLVQEACITLVSNTLAFVELRTSRGQFVKVHGKGCSGATCIAPCAHWFAAAMLRLAQSEAALPLAPTTSTRHYAQLMTVNGPVLGHATYADTGWMFWGEGETDGHYVDLIHLTMLGHVDTSAAQRTADGPLIDAVIRRFDYGAGR